MDLRYLKILVVLLASCHSIYKTVTHVTAQPPQNPYNLKFHSPRTIYSPLSPYESPFDSKLTKCYSLLLSSPTSPFSKAKNGLYIYKQRLKAQEPNHTSFFVLILTCIENNPGPSKKSKTPKFPCGLCHKACTSAQPAVQCDGCDVWYHTRCMKMKPEIYRALHNVSWYCISCGLPNFSSGLFPSEHSSHSFDSMFNPFNTLNSRCCSHTPDISSSPQTPDKNPPTPILASTPKSSKKPKEIEHKSELSTLVINFQSFWNKRAEISNLATDSRADIIIGTETWLRPGDHKNSELLLDEYDVYRRDRPSRGGGILIAIKTSLSSEQISSSKDSETIFCKIKLKGRNPLIVGCAYRPPDYDLDQSRNIAREIYNITNRNKKAVFWFGGDFNLPDVNWKSHEIQGNQYLKEINSLFLEMSQDLGLSQIVDTPTRGTSILDLFFTNNPDFVKNFTIIDGVGDHDIVHVKTSLKPFRKKPVKRTIQLWTKVDEVKLLKETNDLKHTFLNRFSPSDCPIIIWNFLKKEFIKIINNNVPSKTTSSKTHQPWITSETKKLIRKKNRWHQKIKNSNSKNSGKILKNYRKIKSETQRVCRRAHDQYVNEMFSADTSNKKMWSYIKKLGQDLVGVADLKDEQNTLTSDPVKKANLIHKQFDSVFSDDSIKTTPDFVNEERLPTMTSIKITRNGILKLLLNIDPNKAVGPDQIPGNFLKLCANEIADMYVVLFQASLDQGIVPPDWKIANIVPLFKKGDKSLPENYRPISLTSLSCKVLEHVVHSSIMTHLEKHRVLDDAQHGFRKFRSCVSQLIITINDFANCLSNRLQIDAILLDFSKAFDKVDHEILLAKLEHLGIRNSLLAWSRSFLIGRSQRVVVEGMESTPTRVRSGVPQGTVLGPLFFLVYINDISRGLSEGTTLKLFADDSLLYRIIRTPLDTQILQNDLNLLQLWAEKNKMEFHPGKCQLLKITNKIKKIDETYQILNTPIAEVDSAKYLGVVIDNTLSWRPHYNSTIKKCNSTLAFLKRNLSRSPQFVKEKCYTALVRPKLEYACAVWDPHHQNHIDDLEKVQKRAARFVTNNYKMETGNTQFNLDSLEWPKLQERRLENKLTLFQKARLNLVDIPTDHLNLRQTRTRQGGGGPTYDRTFSKIDAHIHSFYPQSSALWNRLPPDLRTSEDLDIFSKGIKNIDLMALNMPSYAKVTKM